MASNCGLPWPPLRKHRQIDKSNFERYSHGLPQWEATVGGHSGRPQWEATVGGHSWTVFPGGHSGRPQLDGIPTHNFKFQFPIFNFQFSICNFQFAIYNFQFSNFNSSLFNFGFFIFHIQFSKVRESRVKESMKAR